MGYRALLFCPDEKTAQSVTQVLNDLEFSVEACSEPFAAVKKLMGEHFDGVVVDCDNEQNATLLFKSARQSTTNQASLAVAVVEGQAGVAKAFRIGANLVLTKPINLEQSKGTLRVARGLLRKSEALKPPAHAENAPASVAAPPSSVSRGRSASTGSSLIPPSVAAVAKKLTTAPAQANPWGTRAAFGTAQAATVTAKDLPTSAISSDELSGATESDSTIVAASASTVPVASTAFSAVKQMSKKASASPNSVSSNPTSPAMSAVSVSATTPGPSKPATPAAEPLLSKIARTVGKVEEPASQKDAQGSAAATGESLSDGPAISGGQPESQASFSPTLQAKTDSKAQSEASVVGSMSTTRKTLLAVAAVVLLAVAVYFGWAQLHGQAHLGSAVVTNSAPMAAAKSQQPAMPNASSDSASNSLAASPKTTTGDAQTAPLAHQSASNQVQNETASDSTEDASTTRTPNKAASGPGLPGTGVHALLMRSSKANSAKRAAADTAAPNVVVPQENSAAVLPNLIDVSIKSTPVLQTLSVSQGVSQGLIIKKVQPTYPSTALHLHLEGPVHLVATVSKSGNITSVKTLQGDPLLAQAATDAVKQWKYKPYLLNGEPVEIQTQVTINFKLPR